MPITLTRYEVAKLIGLRALQLEQDALPLVDVKPNEPFIHIATRELHSKRIDAVVVRGDAHYHLSQAEIPQELHALHDTQTGSDCEVRSMSGW